MTDSWDYLKKASDAASRGQSGNRQYSVLADSQALPTVADPVFRCFTALRAAEPADFHLQPPPDPASTPACATVLATEKNLMALYRTSRDLRAYTQTPGWQEARVRGQFFALLGKHDFQFKDLTTGGRPVTADEAEDAVRDPMQGLAHRLARAQPGFLSSGAVSVAGKAALNSLRYRTPPLAIEVDATINGAGLGGALLLSSQNGWRGELGPSIEPWRLRQLETAPGEPASWVMDSAVNLLFGKEWALGSHDAPPSGRWQLSAAVGGDARVITANRDFFPYLVPSEELLWRVGPTARLRGPFTSASRSAWRPPTGRIIAPATTSAPRRRTGPLSCTRSCPTGFGWGSSSAGASWTSARTDGPPRRPYRGRHLRNHSAFSG